MLLPLREKIKSVILEHTNIRHSLSPIYNLNLNPNRRQKRLAYVYLPQNHTAALIDSNVSHPNVFQHFILLRVFEELGYIVDVYSCQNEERLRARTGKYDVVFGFGQEYINLCNENPQAKKILFITENAPWVVKRKYQERIENWLEGHKKMISTVARNDFYTDEMFSISDCGVCLSGTYNITGMEELLKPIEQLNVNVMPAQRYDAGIKDYDTTKKRFLWFGSRGLIHKGLDILIDAFAQIPQYELNIYGAPEKEIKELVLPTNVHNCGFIQVNSPEFLSEVASRHSFVLSLSCSEGMMSGIATCMMFGMIPVVTKETGYDDCPYALIFEDWHIESVINKIERCAQMENAKVKEIEQKVVNYAHSNYTNEHFEKCFIEIAKKLELSGVESNNLGGAICSASNTTQCLIYENAA